MFASGQPGAGGVEVDVVGHDFELRGVARACSGHRHGFVTALEYMASSTVQPIPCLAECAEQQAHAGDEVGLGRFQQENNV